MAIAIRQLQKHFVGEVSGLELRKPLTKAEAAEIEAGMDKYAVLVFRGQDITDDQQMAFALNFGERENPQGGNTEFAHMPAAYDALDDETKAEIGDLICEHSLMYSRGSLGFLDYTDDEKAMFKPGLQRL